MSDVAAPAPVAAPVAQPQAAPPAKAVPQRVRIDQIDSAPLGNNELSEDVSALPSEEGAEPESYEEDVVDEAVEEPEAEQEYGAEYERLKAMFDDPTLAPELMDKLLTITVDGIPEQITIAECASMGMMQRDYSRKTAEAARVKDQAERTSNTMHRIITDLSSPQTFIATIEELSDFHPDIATAFDAAVEQRAEQEAKIWEACGNNPAVFKLYKDKIASDRNAARATRELEFRNQRDQQAQQERQQAAITPEAKMVYNQLTQLVPKIYKEIGLENNEFTQQQLGIYLPSFWKDRSQPLTAKMVKDAAKAVKQTMQANYRSAAGKVQGQHQPPPGVSRLPAGPNPNATSSGGRRRLRIDEI